MIALVEHETQQYAHTIAVYIRFSTAHTNEVASERDEEQRTLVSSTLTIDISAISTPAGHATLFYIARPTITSIWSTPGMDKSMGHEGLSTMSKQDDFEAGADYIDKIAERKLVRKIDLCVIPLIMLLYLLSFLDRVNIGNARLYGLESDLGLSSIQYQTAVSLLFATYIISEVPSNWIVKHYVRPSRWISFITTSWGIIATLTGICQSYGGLIACRLLLGLVEGGLFPALTIYLTFFYTKRELALRIGYLFVSSAIAGAFGGLLAFAIGYMDGVAGLRGWRWIMSKTLQ